MCLALFSERGWGDRERGSCHHSDRDDGCSSWFIVQTAIWLGVNMMVNGDGRAERNCILSVHQYNGSKVKFLKLAHEQCALRCVKSE